MCRHNTHSRLELVVFLCSNDSQVTVKCLTTKEKKHSSENGTFQGLYYFVKGKVTRTGEGLSLTSPKKRNNSEIK